MTPRYFCLDERCMIPDPEWSWVNNGSGQCYVKADAYTALERELSEAQQQIRYLESLQNINISDR